MHVVLKACINGYVKRMIRHLADYAINALRVVAHSDSILLDETSMVVNVVCD